MDSTTIKRAKPAKKKKQCHSEFRHKRVIKVVIITTWLSWLSVILYVSRLFLFISLFLQDLSENRG